MPGHGRQCAYVGCNKTTDKRSFGQPRTLTADQLSSYSTWLKSPNDGAVCNYHHILLRRLLEKQQQQVVVDAGIDELLAAAAAMADVSLVRGAVRLPSSCPSQSYSHCNDTLSVSPSSFSTVFMDRVSPWHCGRLFHFDDPPPHLCCPCDRAWALS